MQPIRKNHLTDEVKKLLVCLVFLFFGIYQVLNAQQKIPEDFCLSTAELKLFNLINQYRRDFGLPSIELSKNLTYVAKVHVYDLSTNRPDVGNCNLHSWSNAGFWTPCCYGKDASGQRCMTSKPSEISNYQYDGYEVAFWESLEAIPEIVLDSWINSSASNEMLLNRGKWSNKPWKAIGVGIYKGYAVVWLGHEADNEKKVKICPDDFNEKEMFSRVLPQIEKQSSTAEQFYLILASFKDQAQAEREVNILKNKGFKNAMVMVYGNNYRVALGGYTTREQALEAKKKLGNTYQSAWVFSPK